MSKCVSEPFDVIKKSLRLSIQYRISAHLLLKTGKIKFFLKAHKNYVNGCM
jgi:hypothetical protein